MQNDFRLKLLASAIAMAAATSASAAAVSSAFVPLTHAQHATVLHNGEVVTGPVAASQIMHVSVSLNLQNQDKLDAFLANAAKPETPVAQRSMSSADFLAQYSPTQAQAQAVAAYLSSAGFHNVTIAPNRQLVSADATADTVRAAFNTSFESARTKDGRVGYHNTGDVRIPGSLKDTVLGVVGLDTVHISHTFAKKMAATVPAPVPGGLPLGASNNSYTTAPAGHDPADFESIYGADSLLTASTVPVGIITEGSMANVVSDLKMYTVAHGMPKVVTHTVTVDGGSADVSGDVEWDLDSQDITGISGGVAAIYFYATTGLTDVALNDDYNRAVSDNVVKLINVSLGECETDAQTSGTAGIEDQIFKQAVAQGQTFSVSSGDDGANECGLPQTQALGQPGLVPSWPASSRYVVSVGGTEVYTSDPNTITGPGGVPNTGSVWSSEIVWNNKSEHEGATGGSPSTFESIPTWQLNIGANQGSNMRGVPDLSFDGSPDSGAIIWSDGKAGSQVGGTSLSSPLFVGAWARTIANNIPKGRSPVGYTLGFAAPLIYRLPSAAFHDITVGDNDGESSARGWDYTTGFGSPIVRQMSRYAVAPPGGTPVAAFTYAKVNNPKTMWLEYQFTDTSTDAGGAVTTHSWAFDYGGKRDGGVSSEINPDHTFPVSGDYVVREIVTDGVSGKTSHIAHLVHVLSGVDDLTGRLPAAPPAPPTPPALP